MPESMPLSQTIEQSQTIAIVTMVDYQAGKPPPEGGIAISGGGRVYVGPSVFTSFPMKPAGHYTFHVLKTLKGTLGPTLDIDLPYLLRMYYGGAKLVLQNGSTLIIFLQGSADSLSPTDPTRPFVPITTASTSLANDSGDIQAEVYSLMLASCSDATIRQTNAFILRTETSPQIVTSLFPYIDDSNPLTRDFVLYCMATNQQVAAIPRIVALDIQTTTHDTSTESIGALGLYRTPEALPFLNPLLFSSHYYLRINAMRALSYLADRTSIPYLILALRDPDRQHFITESAYGLLYQLNPSLGTVYGSGYFTLHQSDETTKLYAWWDDELLGKHLSQGTQPSIPTPLPDTPSLLNPLLFTPDTATRRTVVARLYGTGDASSIPYLILALQDPDPKQTEDNVSYVAYKTLHNLIPSLGQTQNCDWYLSHHDAVTQPIYAWWQDELNGKHTPNVLP